MSAIPATINGIGLDGFMQQSKPDALLTRKLVNKLAEVMAEIDHVEKRGRNESQSYDYVKAADLANIVRKKLASRKVMMLSSVEEATHFQVERPPDAQGNQRSPMLGVHIKVKYTFHDGETGEQLSFNGFGTGLDTGDKAIYKAHTGALKYALRNAFLVPDEKGDPEADEKVDKEVEAVPQPEAFTVTVLEAQKVKDEVYGKLMTDSGTEMFCVTGSDPNKQKLLDAKGKTVEVLLMRTNRTKKDAEGNKQPIYSLHMVSPA